MRRSVNVALWATSGLLLVAAITFPTTEAGGPFRNPMRARTSVEDLAEAIDKLERGLQYYGRVTAKAPDVWGQARLTQHRREFEEQMAEQLTAFTPNLNAEISVSDQAFLSQAIALSAASKGVGAAGVPELTSVTSATSTFTPVPATGAVTDPATKPGTTTTNVISRTGPFGGFATTTGQAALPLTLEPEIVLDQRKRFLDHLHEIRRVNEGDDTADAPGYSLNLVRIPISVIPGDKTRENYGAEVTVTAESHVTEELLETTFRELVINDLIDQLALPIVKVLNLTWKEHLECERLRAQYENERDQFINLDFINLDPKLSAPLIESQTILRKVIADAKSAFGVQMPRERRSRYPVPPSQIRNVFGEREIGELTVAVFSGRDRFQCRDRVHLADVQGFLRNELEHAYDFLSSTACSELVPSLGVDGVVQGCDLWHSPNMPSPGDIRQPTLVIAKRKNFFVGLPVNSEGIATHPSEKPGVHDNHAETATEALAWAILVESSLLNQQLNEDLQRVSQDPNCHCVPVGQPYCFSGPNPDPAAKQAFVEYVKCRWPIRVFALDPVTQQQNVADSFSLRREMQLAIALAFKQQFVNAQSLTRYMRRIEQDVRTIALNQTTIGFGAGDDTFGWRFLPRVQTPDVEGTLTVIGRDLILGGPNKDQGLRRRRMEPGMRECMALVVMPSFIKHVRFDVRTNWFPLVPCHITKFFHSARTPASMEKTVEWSKLIKSMEDSAMMCVKDQHKYRDGEVERLLKRSHQLSQELPINTMYAQVPYENTLGGFEMFASGVTDLAPELVGFYGAPGVDPNLPTELFLVGDHFSVHDTNLIAGNTQVKFKLLSREVMQVTIPANVRIEQRLSKPRSGIESTCCKDGDCDDSYVEVRLATPYGVSSALWVPVVAGRSTAQAQIRWDRESYNVTYGWVATDQSFDVVNKIRAVAPHRFAIDIPANYWTKDTTATLSIAVKSPVVGEALIPPPDDIPAQKVAAAGGRFIIEQDDFIKLQQQIQAAVIKKLTVANPNAKGPPPNYTVRLSAKIKLVDKLVDGDKTKEVDVANDLQVCIRFVQKP